MTEQTAATIHLQRKLLPMDGKVESVKQGRSVVVTIGINNYDNWQQLRNAVQDALGFQQALVEKLGFLAPIPLLIDSAATRDAIESLVKDRLWDVLEEDDSLVLFFAGHGHTRVEEHSETGFIVPVDARRPDTKEYWSDYIRLSHWLEEVAELPARHILVIFDSCHSGFALGGAAHRFRDAVRYQKDLTHRRSRKVITSAQRDQSALDGGPIPGHSLFTGTLIHGFNWGEADLESNGLITGSELGLFVQQKVAQASNSAQTPDFGSFHLDDRGEIVFSLRNQSFEALKARAFSALQTGQLALFKDLTQQVIALKPSSPEVLYLEFRLRFIERQFDRVTEVIEQLVNLSLNESQIPLSNNDLLKIQVRLPYWIPVFLIPESNFPLEVAVLNGPTQDDLRVVEEQPLGDLQGYLIESKTFCQLRITNPTQNPVHVYMVGFDETGRFQLETLWDDANLILQGVPPTETTTGYIFKPQGQAGIREVRLFSSPKQIPFLLFSASPDAYGAQVDAIDRDDLKGIRMKSIRFSLTTKLPQN
ncbi:MAG: caspase family protein [Phormidium tanganyikae FI6-MK23]|nr:caspase family protein [Phormidium tanganyikae FI6-MK23]